MKIIGNRNPVPAPKYPWRLTEIANNPCAAAMPPPLKTEKAMEDLIRIPEHGKDTRLLPAEERLLATARIPQAIIPVSTSADAYACISRLMPLAYVGRSINDPGFIQWAHGMVANQRRGKKARKELPVYQPILDWGQVVAHPRCALVCGKPGTGKTTILKYILWYYYRDRVLEHINSDGDSFTQIPYLWVECSSLGSAVGLVRDIIRAIAFLVGIEAEHLCASFKKGHLDDLIPEMVNLLLLYSVGPIFIDEAEAVRAEYSGGNKALNQLWVRLVNDSNTSIILIANPDIVDGMDKQLKVKLRFSGGGSIKFDKLEADSLDWMNFFGQLGPVQYTATPTLITPQIIAKMHDRSQGLIKLTSYLWEWTQNLAIEEGETEEITLALIDAAWHRNAGLVHKIIKGIALTDEERKKKNLSLSHFASDIDCSWMEKDGVIIPVDFGTADNDAQEGRGSEAESQGTVEPAQVAPPVPIIKRTPHSPRAVPAKMVDFVRCADDDKFKKGRTAYQAFKDEGWVAMADEFAC